MRNRVKELLILAYLAAGAGDIWARTTSLGLSASLLLWMGLYGLLALSLFLAAAVKDARLRWFYAVLLAASSLFLGSTERVMDEHLSYDAYLNLVHSTGWIGDALAQYGRAVVWTVPASLLLCVGIGLKPSGPNPWHGAASVAAPPMAVLLLGLVLFLRGGEGGRALPGAFLPLSYSAIHLAEQAGGDDGPRQPVKIARPRAPLARDIVFVIDESVTGDWLDINDPDGARSGLAEPRPGVRIRNYGLAAAINNCSVGANLTLRHGGTRSDYQRINATMPSLFDYAHAAGMETVYLDAQRTGGRLHNGMTHEEAEALDHFVQYDRVPVVDRDQAIADSIARRLANDRSEFILVNKVGAHFPIHDKYPDSHLVHRPALPRGRFIDITDTGSRTGFGGTPHEWALYRNSYRNTLAWNVGAFFERLLGKADLSRATIVYTSDHGQDLHETGAPGLATHCSSKPVPAEGIVPLVVIEGEMATTLDWDANLAANRDRVSHYQIFPTLLALMGYDPEAVEATYGASLVPRSRDPGTFNTRYNARLGREPLWVAIR